MKRTTFYTNIFIFLALVSAIICLSSCEDRGVSEGRRAYKTYFKKTLKDPNSFVIYSEEVLEKTEHSAVFVLDIGAKNSFGAMVRQIYTIRTIGENIANINDYDIRTLPKKENNKSDVHFTYKEKMTPVAGFDPHTYVGKTIVLEDSCVYSNLEWEIDKVVRAAKERDFKKIDALGGIIPKGSKIYILSTSENYFGVESEKHKSVDIYIEQSAIF